MTTNVETIKVYDVSYNKQNKPSNVGSSFCATGAGIGGSFASAPLSLAIAAGMNKITDLSEDKVKIVHEAAEEALKKADLHTQDIKINYLPMIENNLKNKILSCINPLTSVKMGYNAFAIPEGEAFYDIEKQSIEFLEKGIYMPEKKIAPCVFHEIGHQMNYHFSKIGKALQYMRMPAMIVPFAIMLYGAFTKKSEPDKDGQLSTKDKTKNFIRDNAGKLSFIAMLPVLIEEGMATIKGQNLAKKILDKDLISVVKKGNALAYTTYILAAATAAFSSWLAVKVKDKMVENKKQKFALENQNVA